MVIKLYSSGMSPFVRAVQVLAKLISVELQVIQLDTRNKKVQLSPEFLKINPFHTVPTIDDDGFKLFESRAIMMYLLRKYAPESDLYPKDLHEQAIVDAMINFDAGTLSPGLISRFRSIKLTGKEPAQWSLDRCQDNLKCLDQLLSTRRYAAGDRLTIADISIIHTLTFSEALEDDYTGLVHLSQFLKGVREELGNIYTEVNAGWTEKMKDYMRS